MRAPKQASTTVRLCKFFRQRLLTLDNEQIVEYIDQLEKEVRAIKEDSIRMCWWMRGGLSLSESLDLGALEKELIGKLIKENIESTKKTQISFI